MSQFVETVARTADQAVDLAVNEIGVEKLWVPEGAGALATNLGEFGRAIVGMEGLARDTQLDFLRVPVALNMAKLQAQEGQLVGVMAPDSEGASGLFPGIILPSEKPDELKVGILNTAPYKDSTGTWRPGDKLGPGDAPTQQQAFQLHLMGVKEARGAGAHGQDDQASAADVVHGGVAFGMMMNPDWAANPHGTVHTLVDTKGAPGSGVSSGFSQAGLSSVVGKTREDVVMSPDAVYWNPKFASVELPDPELLERYTGTELVVAVGFAAVKNQRHVPNAVLKTELATGIKAVEIPESQIA